MSDKSTKVPSQIFRWFEKMKSNYEQSIHQVLKRYEHFTKTQQERVDNANQAHLADLKKQHQAQLEQQEAQIAQLTKDVAFYKNQIETQHATITDLNKRYDTVMHYLLAEKQTRSTIKDVIKEDDHNTDDIIASQLDGPESDPNNTNVVNLADEAPLRQVSEPSAETIYQKALETRQRGDQNKAFDLFEKAATLGNADAMGALARSYFLAEGCPEDELLGLAWLIEAADKGLPKAVTRLAQFQESDPELVMQAYNLKSELLVIHN